MQNYIVKVALNQNYVWNTGTLVWDPETQAGGGNQYTEDVAAVADPVGNAVNLIRKDTPAGITSADGDNISQRGTNYGAAFVQVVNSTGSFVDTFGGGTQYTEDAVAAADPVGNAHILVRQDAPAGLTSADGDNVGQRGTNFGAAFVQVVSSAGAFVDTFGGGSQYTEDAVSAADPVGNQLISRRRDALASEVSADGDVIALNSTSKGELYVKQTDVVPVSDNAGSLTVDNPVLSVVGGGVEATAQRVTIASDSTGVLSIDDNGGSLTVDGTVSVSGAVDTELPAAAALADNTANPTVPAVGAFLMAYDGTNWDRVQTGAAATGSLKVDGSAVTQPVSGSVSITGAVDTELPAAAVLADNTANPTVPAVGSFLMAWDGTNWDRVQTGAAAGGALKVDGTATTQPVSGTVTANAGAGPFPVSDNAGSLTVDAPVGTPVFVRLSDGAATLIGQKAMAASLPVVIASDQSAVPVSGTVSITANSAVNVAQVAGTATSVNSGNKDAGTLRVTLATDQVQLTNALKVDGSAVTQPVSIAATVVVDERRAQTPLFAVIDTAASGDNTIVAADATRKIKVLSYVFVTDGIVSVRWKSGGATSLTGAMSLVANTGISSPAGSMGSWLMETAAATALVLNLSGAVGVRGHVAYFLEL